MEIPQFIRKSFVATELFVNKHFKLIVVLLILYFGMSVVGALEEMNISIYRINGIQDQIYELRNDLSDVSGFLDTINDYIQYIYDEMPRE